MLIEGLFTRKHLNILRGLPSRLDRLCYLARHFGNSLDRERADLTRRLCQAYPKASSENPWFEFEDFGEWHSPLHMLVANQVHEITTKIWELDGTRMVEIELLKELMDIMKELDSEAYKRWNEAKQEDSIG